MDFDPFYSYWILAGHLRPMYSSDFQKCISIHISCFLFRSYEREYLHLIFSFQRYYDIVVFGLPIRTFYVLDFNSITFGDAERLGGLVFGS